MKSGSHCEQAGNAAAQSDTPSGRHSDSAQELEKGGFPSAIATDDAHNVALLDFQTNTPQCPEFLSGRAAPPSRRPKPLQRVTHRPFEGMPQAIASGSVMPEVITFGKVFAGDDRITHRLGVRRLNWTSF